MALRWRRFRPRNVRRGSATYPRSRSCSLAQSKRTSCWARRVATNNRSWTQRARWLHSRPISKRYPLAWQRRSASWASACRVGSASASPWRGRSRHRPRPDCSCLTTHSRPSISTPRHRSSPVCVRHSVQPRRRIDAPRSCCARIVSRPSLRPTGWLYWSPAGSRSRAPTPIYSAQAVSMRVSTRPSSGWRTRHWMRWRDDGGYLRPTGTRPACDAARRLDTPGAAPAAVAPHTGTGTARRAAGQGDRDGPAAVDRADRRRASGATTFRRAAFAGIALPGRHDYRADHDRRGGLPDSPGGARRAACRAGAPDGASAAPAAQLLRPDTTWRYHQSLHRGRRDGRHALLNRHINLVANLVRLLTAAVAMALLSTTLTLVAIVVIPPLVAVTRLFQVRVRAAERENRRAVGLLNTHLQETLGGAEVIRAFGRVDTFVARFRRALRESLAAYNRATVYSAIYSPIMALLAASAIALLLWAGAGGIVGSWGISVGMLTAFVLLFQRFFEPITTLGDDWQTVQSALSGIERIVEVLALAPETRPPPQPAAPHQAPIEMHNVTFGYRDQPVLHRISFHVRPGEHVALVGRTGAGKSSALHLVGGLYTPWSGTVRVAGRDPRSLSDEKRRRIVGVVPQLVQLFSGTVWDNLTLGDSSVSRVAVERAAKIAGAAAWVESLPQGYDTPLSGAGRSAGAQLSAGQRQLLALARALVWDPPVLLLDEATAAIDSASDAALWAALRADVAGHGRVVLAVAHRLATARVADRVIALEAGRIVEIGPPEELVRRGGRFAALVELEAAGWRWQAS